jgi:hypothetical protein
MAGRFISEEEGRSSINRKPVGLQRGSEGFGKDINLLVNTGAQTMNCKDCFLVVMSIILSPNTNSLDSEMPYAPDTVYIFLLHKID